MTEAEKFIREYFKTETNADALHAFFKCAAEVLCDVDSVEEGKKKIIEGRLFELIDFPDYCDGESEEDFESYELTSEDKEYFCGDYAQRIIENPAISFDDVQKDADSYAEECYKEMQDIQNEAYAEGFKNY